MLSKSIVANSLYTNCWWKYFELLVVKFNIKSMAHIVTIHPTKTAISSPFRSGTLFFTLLNFSWPSSGCCLFKLTTIFWWNFHSLYFSFAFLILVLRKAMPDVKNIIERKIGPYTFVPYFNLMPDKSWKCTVS